MKRAESLNAARQHIEASLRGLAKEAMDRAHESRARAGVEDDAQLREIWQAEAAAELSIAKQVNATCDTLLARFDLY